MTTKRTVTALTLLVASLLVGGLAHNAPAATAPGVRAGQPHHECSVETLYGDYLMTGNTVASPIGREVIISIFTFDGAGMLTTRFTRSREGKIEHDERTATYTLDADCDGTVVFSAANTWRIMVTRDGSEGALIRTNDGWMATRTIKKR